ncbi:TPA: helix-turn-helix domain-containing protein [Neisseria weaveri]
MTDTDFHALLKAADINQTELSKRLGISTTSISKWHKKGAPKYAVAYLELLAKYNRLLDKL